MGLKIPAESVNKSRADPPSCFSLKYSITHKSLFHPEPQQEMT